MTGKFLIWFDVTSLFTNIPLSKSIDVSIHLIFENSSDINFTKRELWNLFRTTTSEICFIFKGSIFDQIDDVAMGSSLVPVLANLFMSLHEQNMIQQATNAKPIFYERYVDDINAALSLSQMLIRFIAT